MTQAEKDVEIGCRYSPTDAELPFPRKEWKSECGFLYASDSEVWSGTKIIKRVPIGKCMKCKRPIALDEAEKDAEAGKAPGDPLVTEVMQTLDRGGWNRDLATRIIEIVRAHDAKQKAGE